MNLNQKPLKYLIYCSNGDLGGAERSLLDIIGNQVQNINCNFIVPELGSFTDELVLHGFTYTVIPWPKGIKALTQRSIHYPLLPSCSIQYIRLACVQVRAFVCHKCNE